MPPKSLTNGNRPAALRRPAPSPRRSGHRIRLGPPRDSAGATAPGLAAVAPGFGFRRLVRRLDGQRPEDLVAQLRLEILEAALPGGGALAQQSGEHLAALCGHALAGAALGDQP